MQKHTIILTNEIVCNGIEDSVLTHGTMDKFLDVSHSLVCMCWPTFDSH